MRVSEKIILGALLAVLGGMSTAFAEVPYPRAHEPKAIDLGSMRALENTRPVTVTVALKLQHAAQMQALLNRLYTPGSPAFHRFLTPQEFRARFAPDPATVAAMTRHFESFGLGVRTVNGTFLKVSGSPADIERAFQVRLHVFEVPAHGRTEAYRYHAPVSAPGLSPSLAANVQAMFGFDSRPRFRPLHNHLPAQLIPRAEHLGGSRAVNTPDPPGFWTVTDTAQYYGVTPLYNQGITGAGETLGIVTLAAFTPSDAFTYWSSLGLNVNPNRITVVNVDGGPGAPSDASGSIETTLDVEQSGGLAPGANIIVYQAPNTDQGFVDAFAQAVGDNNADSVSVSWGEWEAFAAQVSVNDPVSGQAADELQAFNDVFLQAAIQGQSLFAAAGDSGAYDANAFFPVPYFSKVLSVDDPADEPFITAAGGTTLPGQQIYGLRGGGTYTINIPHERVWGWDYLTGLCRKLGFDPVSCRIFPVGGGGGVSVYFRKPFYQFDLDGVRRSQPHQSLIDYTQTPPQTLLTLPANFAGRNVPDISLNADPDTGYVIFYTSDQTGFGVASYYGGTSFVAPQLNGITALIDQDVGGRVGLLNFGLYTLVRFPSLAYEGREAPLRDIRDGDNWFYQGREGYDPASGVGVPNVAHLANAYKNFFEFEQ